jgi:glycosyltransferase involved in cell wall biosynthesis
MHSNSITERGTTSALMDYAIGLREFGIIPVISWEEGHVTNIPSFVRLVQENFETMPYKDFSETKMRSSDFDAAYFIKGGENDGKVLDIEKNLIHVVFQNFDPHGSKYFYVSKWLAEFVEQKLQVPREHVPLPFLPHIVDLPNQQNNIRKEFGIPNNALLGIRIGGFDTFDIKFVHYVVKFLLHVNRNLYFIFVNTRQFIRHPRALFVGTITDKQSKSNYLQSADFFLHARGGGESFGIAIVEAMSLGLPILAWRGGTDLNHTELLGDNSLYSDVFDLVCKIQDIRNYSDISRNYDISLNYKTEPIIEKFLKFLK